MRFSIRGHARHSGRAGRRTLVAAATLALLTGALAGTSFADDSPSGPVLHPPKGSTVVAAGGNQVTPQIVGGTNATATEAPFMVQLFFDYDHAGTEYYFTCGGTLVAPTKVLTAAHCMYDGGARIDWNKYGAVLANTTKLAGGDAQEGDFIDVTRTYIRGTYNDVTIDNDIALLTLAKPVPGASTLAMANTEDSRLYSTTDGVAPVSYGWGLTTSDRETAMLADTLQKVPMPLHTDAECAARFDEMLPQQQGMYKAGHMVCGGEAGTGDDATGQATCPGDSGSALVKEGHVIGVTSWGISDDVRYCNVAGAYEVFSKVSTYEGYVRPRVDDTDINRNGKADLYLRYKDGVGYYRASTGSGFGGNTKLTGSWSAYNTVLQTDLNRDSYQDYILRRTSDGAILWRHRTPSSATWIDTKLTTGWQTRKAIAAPGDVTGDRYPDLVSTTSDGTLYVYPGKGNGTFGARVTAGSGYQVYNSFRGHGDFNMDGKTDIIARRSKDSSVVLLKGTGKATAPYAAPITVRSWPIPNAFSAPGDVTGDGIADFVARSPAGNLYLYPGTGKTTSAIFGTAIKIGSGFQNYNQFG
ncbi:hypothetical protein SRB5_21310 [Streptomyces sp. RB5]|uniref:Peptidase S1 domain-containing protein n=1 Tax=Streptomyces smaragdinus TaxID=2585196 RepID=A0A7K0CG55_9ACTN|nr:trypsin-like serine protease [Streptomyces smaragdinus]MQY12002.1 hypothetical protein [Streptomyces smaragdinus]